MWLKNKSKNWRYWLGFLILLTIWSSIIARLIYLQIQKGEFYKALAKGQQEIIKQAIGERGKIYFHDKDNIVLAASNKKEPFCYLSLKSIKNEKEIALKISSVLNLSETEILNKIQNSKSYFLVIKRNLKPEEVKKLRDLKIKGLYLDYEEKRFYPLEQVGSDLLGFVNVQGKGNYGVEGYFDTLLSGKEKLIKEKYNFFGRVAEVSPIELKGSDIVLSLDKNIQEFSEKLLENASKDLEISSGQIIVANPKTGKILAMADWPFFNPNQYKDYASNPRIFLNKAIQTLYEPGSTFKPITMSAAVNEKKVKPDTTYEDKGYVKIGGRTIYNYNQRVWGKRTMKQVLQYSINTGAVFAEKQLGHKLFLKYLERFGVFKKTGIELEGEIFSTNEELKKGYEVNFATAAFGQGIELTPLGLLRAYTALANNGNLMSLSIVDRIIENGREKIIEPKIERKKIISEETAKEITKMLVSVVEEGYGKRAGVPGYYIAGKTGTSQISFASLGINKKGYSDETWQSFIGYFPAFDPQVLILVKLDNPKAKTAEYSACPIFRRLAQYIINYYKIPPDYSLEEKTTP
ncbi:penicillin-binding protein 2 [bacterium]|nr:penicillin-binding protein 2 [bacterium]